jgi:hypothetical protein
MSTCAPEGGLQRPAGFAPGLQRPAGFAPGLQRPAVDFSSWCEHLRSGFAER